MKNPFLALPGLQGPRARLMKVLLGISILLFGYSVSGFVGVGVASAVTKVPLARFATQAGEITDAYITGLKIVQFFIDLGIFVVPALLLPLLFFNTGFAEFTGLKKRPVLLVLLIAAALTLCIQPVVDLSARYNMMMKLPSGLSGLETRMKNAQEQTEAMMKHILNMHGTGDLMINILFVAIMPAIFEEMFFRGFLQKSLMKWTGRPHFAIFIAAAVFSFIHFEFYVFVPRLLLGMLLGYAFYWSGDLKVPIFIHFINNLLDLVLSYIYGKQAASDVAGSQAGTSPLPWVYYLLAFVFMFVLLYLFRKTSQAQKPIGYESDKTL